MIKHFWNKRKRNGRKVNPKFSPKDKTRPKSRVITRNKELTKSLILEAARHIIETEGYRKLGVNKIADASGRSKKMIYDYFGGIEGIVNKLLTNQDTWLSFEDRIAETIEIHKFDHGRELAISAFERHFYQIKSDPLLQEFGLLELSDDDKFLSELAEKRERLADQLFSITEGHFKDSNVHFRAVCAILNSGINHLVLHSKIRNSPYCGIDINKMEDREKLIETIKLIINSAYDAAKNNND